MIALMRRVAGSSVTHVLFAFLAMGGWALYANGAHPVPKMLTAGLVQGAMSACITFVLKSTIDRLAATLPRAVALWAPPLVAFAVSATMLSLIHWLAGTPEILRTVALPLSVATTYAAIYNFSIWTKARPVHG